MADFNAVGDASASLASVLTAGLSVLQPAPPPIAEVHDLQGSIATTPARLTVTLFDLIEDPSARNRPRVRELVAGQISEHKTPMALLLRYLLTPWSGDRITDHRILGRTLQILYDNAILSGSQLTGGLQTTTESLKITLSSISLEDRAWFWQAVQKPYRISAVCEVRVVNVDSVLDDRRDPVSSRVLDYALPERSL